MLIESLTQDQLDSMSVIRDRWIAIGLNTAPMDYPAAIQAVKEAYNSANLEAPKFYIFSKGPAEALKFLAFAPFCSLSEERFKSASEDSVLGLTSTIREEMAHYEKEKGPLKYSMVMPSFYGQHEAGWLSFHNFFYEHFGLSSLSLVLQSLAKQAEWVWMYKDLVVISQRATSLTLNSRGQLHNERGPAISYEDGTAIYAFNGVNLPKNWVLERDTMDPIKILQCSDTDVRAAGIALFGYDRLKKHLDYKIIEGDPSTDIGALVELRIPGLSRPGRFLEAICPRNGPVFLGVPNKNPWGDNQPILTAVGAQAFLARLPESAYQHPPIRT